MKFVERFERGVSFLQGLATLLWATWCYQRGIPFGDGFKVWFAFMLVTTVAHYTPGMLIGAWRGRRRWRESVVPVLLFGGVIGLTRTVVKALHLSIDVEYTILPIVAAVGCGALMLWFHRDEQRRLRGLPDANPAELPASDPHSAPLAPVDRV